MKFEKFMIQATSASLCFVALSCSDATKKPTFSKPTSPSVTNSKNIGNARVGSSTSSTVSEMPGAPGVPGVPKTPSKDSAASLTALIQDYIKGIGHLNSMATEDVTPKFMCAGKESVVACPQVEEKMMSGIKTLCTFQDKKQTIVPTEISVVSSNADSLWPGALIQSQSVAEGALDPIPIRDRKEGTIVLTIASGGNGNFAKVIPSPSLASSTQAMNQILATNLKDPAPAKFSYRVEQIHDEQQIKLALKASYKGLTWGGSASLGFDAKDEKNRVLVEFTQEYFTMAYEAPQGAGGVFGPSVTVDALKPYMRANNPLLYVSSVTYGRRFYFLFESTASMKDLEAAISGSYGNPLSGTATASVSSKYQDIVNTSHIKAFAIGGDASEAIQAVTGSKLNDAKSGKSQLDLIYSFLISGAKFSERNSGAPIAYSLRYLDDATLAKLAFTTDFRSKNCVASSAIATFYSGGDYHGYPLGLGIGSYNYQQLKDLGLRNDTLSSVRMPPGLKAVIWNSGDFKGEHYEIIADNSNLKSIGFNDKTSSIEVKARD